MHQIQELHNLFLTSSGISTDSRENLEGKLFVALKGDRFDGNEYALKALNHGAVGAIVDRQELMGRPGCCYVKNSLTTLQRLAYYHRKKFQIPVIGITGSNGKTTSKELITSVLRQNYDICATKGNLNNHIGVPLTLLQIDQSTELAVIEMGANHPGEIGWLCQIAAPTMGLVTNVGSAHLEGFGSLENIWDTKMDLFRYLDARSGIVFINLEEPSLEPLKGVTFEQSVRFDRNNVGNQAIKVQFDANLNTIDLRILSEAGTYLSTAHLYGAHNINNLLCAIAIGVKMNVPLDKICAGITKYRSNQNRSQVVEKESNIFYLDAYNANPTSMRKALEFFANMPVQNKVAILGDMMELGSEAKVFHQEIVDFIQGIDLSELLLVGGNFQACHLDQSNYPILFFNNASSLKEYLTQKNYQHTHFLIKGSRSMKLETVIL